MLLNLVIQLLMKQGANFMSQKPLSWLCDLHSLFCWELLELEPEFSHNELLRACRIWPGTCTSLASSPPHSAAVAVTLLSLQLSQACSHLRAFPLPHPTYIPGTFSSLSPSDVSPACEIRSSQWGLPGPVLRGSSCSPQGSCSPLAWLGFRNFRCSVDTIYAVSSGGCELCESRAFISPVQSCVLGNRVLVYLVLFP